MIFKIKNMCIYIKTHIMSTETLKEKKISINCLCGGRYQLSSKCNHKRTLRHKKFLQDGIVFSVDEMWSNLPLSELTEKQQNQKREYHKNYYEKHKNSRKKKPRKPSKPSIINLITKLVNIIENNPDIKGFNDI